MIDLPNVVAISGFAGSGKDTVADIFTEKYGYVKISMADAVKDVLAVVFGWDRDMLQGSTKESRAWRELPDVFWTNALGYEFTPRTAMQAIGTDLFRNHFHPDFWCLAVQKRIMDLSEGQRVVIPDIRFLNEINMARRLDARMFEVRRGESPEWYYFAGEENVMLEEDPSLELRTSMTTLYPEIHESEYRWIGVNKPAILVQNDSSIDALHAYFTSIYGTGC